MKRKRKVSTLPPRTNWTARNPAAPWRVSGNEQGFDEITVRDWLHIERMDSRTWWVRIGQTDFLAVVDRKDGRNVKLVYQGGPELRSPGSDSARRSR